MNFFLVELFIIYFHFSVVGMSVFQRLKANVVAAIIAGVTEKNEQKKDVSVHDIAPLRALDSALKPAEHRVQEPHFLNIEYSKRQMNK